MAIARPSLAAWILLVTSLSSIALAQRTSDAHREAMKQQQAQYEQSIRDLPTLAVKSFDEVLKLRVEANHLVLTTPVRPSPRYSSQRVVLNGNSAAAIVVCTQLSRDVPTEAQFEYIQHSYPDADTFEQMHLLSRPQELQIDSNSQTMEGVRRVMLTQTDERVQLTAIVNSVGADPQNLEIEEKDFATLRRLHPREAEEWLRPIFRQLQQVSALPPDSATAWQVVGTDVPADELITLRLTNEIPKLKSENYRVRRDATERLKKLGGPVCQAIGKLNREALSPEQNVRLDEVVAAFKVIPDADADDLRKDEQFLVDCLYCTDLTLRRLASARLETLAGRPLKIQSNLSPDELAAGIEQLRAALQNAKVAPNDH